MPFSNGNIVIVKMKNNLELVGEFETETEELVSLKQPLQVVFKTIPGLFVPFLTLKDYMSLAMDGVPIEIKKSDISIGPMLAREPFAKFYKLNIQTSISTSKFIDQACNAYVRAETPETMLSPQEKEIAKEQRHKMMLEHFDVRYERPN